MELTSTICYRAVQAHDCRFDGLFFTCVTSTGIYCRPICPTPIPKQENCIFMSTAAAAEKAGFRPCLRCRPEYAPANPSEHSSIAHTFAAHIDETLLLDETVGGAARSLGVSERHLRRLFMQTFGVEIKAYITTRRLLFAKQLLQDTTMSIIQVAYAAGFSTPGRLTINMKKAYGFTPQRLRRGAPAAHTSEPLVLRTDYRPPFNWDALLQFLQARASPSEWVTAGAYHRMVDGREVIITNMPEANRLTIQIPVELSRQAHAILGRARHLFDLDANPKVIEAAFGQDPFLEKLTKQYPGLRVPGCWDAFEMALRAIIGQRISVAGATTIMRRLAERIGVTPEQIAEVTPAAIMAVGLPQKRAAAIHQLGASVQSGKLQLTERDPRKFYDQLVAVKGIGSWTAEYLLMRVVHWPDVFPADDLGLQKAITPGTRQSEKFLRTKSAHWQPWRSYATMLLWKSLSS